MTSIARNQSRHSPDEYPPCTKTFFESLNFPPGNRLADQLDARLRVKRILTRQTALRQLTTPLRNANDSC